MKFNKTILVCVAMACVLALGGTAFAKNRVEVKVTSEPVAEGTTCGKAGGFSFEWDAGSVIEVGDIITLDLDYITPSIVTLCNTIDIYIAKSRVGNVLDGWDAADGPADIAGPWTAANSGLVASYDADTSPIYFQDDSDAPDYDIQIVNADGGAAVDGIYFHIYGTAGTRRLTIEVMGDAGTVTPARIIVGGFDRSAQVGPPAGNNTAEDGDKFVLQFLDQKVDILQGGVYDGVTLGGSVYHDDDLVIGAPLTLDEAVILENTFCINVSAWDVAATSKGTWNVSIDSQSDVFTFIPSNPQIAHIDAAVQPDVVNPANCKSEVPGTIPIDTTQGGTCVFDYEQGLVMGYCPDHIGEHRVILYKTNAASGAASAWSDQFMYSVDLEIQVRREGTSTWLSGDNGVYFQNENVGIVRSTNHMTTDICDDDNDRIDDPADRFAIVGTAGYGTAFATGNCAETNAYRRISNTAAYLDATNTGAYMWIDLPMMAFNSQTSGIMVQPGDDVRVVINVSGTNPNAVNCGGSTFTFGPFYEEIGTFGPCGQNFSVVYPYITDPQDTAVGWYTGFTIVNMSSENGEATVYYYESDGDMGTYTRAFAPREQFIAGASAFVNDLTPDASNMGTLGDAAAYMVVCGDFNIDGFGMVTDVENGYAQGYVTRQPMSPPTECQ